MDYSKWDNLASDESSADEGNEGMHTTSSRTVINPSSSSTQDPQQPQQPVDAKLPSSSSAEPKPQLQPALDQKLQAQNKKEEAPVEIKKRKQFKHNGQLIYEWEQDFEVVQIFIYPPSGITAKSLDINITTDRLRVGVQGNPPFINESFPFGVDASASFWTFDQDDNELEIGLHKAERGTAWPCALRGHGVLSEAEQQQVQKDILLERFGRENPGFDFSNAEVSGQAPDARTFMGGFDRSKIV